MIEAASSVDQSDELVSRYREDCEMRGTSPESLRRYSSSIKSMPRGFLEYLRKDHQVGHKTIENYFSLIASFYDYLSMRIWWKKSNQLYQKDEGQMRKLISVEDMAKLINTTLDIRDKAVITLWRKQGLDAEN